jgi:hypothetical protein
LVGALVERATRAPGGTAIAVAIAVLVAVLAFVARTRQTAATAPA